MKSSIAGSIGFLRSPLRRRKSRWTAQGRGRGAALLAVLLLGSALWQAAVPPAASAGTSEQRLLSITKTTVYGALLGGILGLASALVVHEGYEDDAIRWGVALGAFSGFIYGAVTHEGSDDFSLTRPYPEPADPYCPTRMGAAADLASADRGALLSRGSSPSIGAAFSLDRARNAAPVGSPSNLPGPLSDPTR